MLLKKIRLNKYLVLAGIARSRRQADDLINSSKIEIKDVSGQTQTGDLISYKVDPQTDQVFVNGRVVHWKNKSRIYIMMNKPVGYVCTRQDKHAKKIVFDLIPRKYKKDNLFTVGRLDRDSQGLLLLTNDGDWANKLMHPRYEKEKQYIVGIKGDIGKRELGQFLAGLVINNQKFTMKSVEQLSSEPDDVSDKFSGNKDIDWFDVVLTEGHKRQIRVMFEKFGASVLFLRRIRIGKYHLDDLPLGQIKEIYI